MISIRDVHVTFNAGTPLENKALRGLSLSIPRGEFVTVIGSNGAGKSTCLNVLSGDARVSSGSIEVDGQDVTEWSTPKRAGMIARVFQDPMAGTCEALSIEENMALALRRGSGRGLKNSLDSGRRALFREHLSRLGLGLENRLGDSIGLLSGGQRQAVSLLMAALAGMKILLLDEHTAALDPRTAEFVLQLTDRIVKEHNLTALMVTHSMRNALDHGTRTVMLHEGRVAFDISGNDRQGLGVTDLLKLFERVKKEQLVEDSLLLG
ncbi:ABC transporter ATP-binding protein [Ensifer sp. ENS05]|uniref:ABC transporter ATP-binding protein n=1 Tax=Ensifer sp. ENS05 TaxID=2769277 RepID=UPI001786BD4C|nr:ABC transporter ATP-binding protein [Ensifer sp. ENS05]MBD9597407.1 ABC transporter ATP-binding protein [Ensifer sp. ENS05]